MAQTPLHAAVANGDIVEVKRLLDSGANVHAKDEKGNTPLRLTSCPKVAALLLEGGADVNARAVDGMTPLHRAAYVVPTSLIDVYLERSAVVDAANADGSTPFLVAAMHGNHYQMAVLLKHGANPSVQNRIQRNAFSELQIHGSMREVVIALVAIDSLVRTGESQADCSSLRQRIIDALDRIVLRDSHPPRSSQEASLQFDRSVSYKISDLGKWLTQHLAELRSSIPQFADRLQSETESIRSRNPVHDFHTNPLVQHRVTVWTTKKQPWWKFWAK